MHRVGIKRFEFLDSLIVLSLLFTSLIGDTGGVWKRREDKTKCPRVKGIRNFDITEVIQTIGSFLRYFFFTGSSFTIVSHYDLFSRFFSFFVFIFFFLMVE